MEFHLAGPSDPKEHFAVARGRRADCVELVPFHLCRLDETTAAIEPGLLHQSIAFHSPGDGFFA